MCRRFILLFLLMVSIVPYFIVGRGEENLPAASNEFIQCHFGYSNSTAGYETKICRSNACFTVECSAEYGNESLKDCGSCFGQYWTWKRDNCKCSDCYESLCNGDSVAGPADQYQGNDSSPGPNNGTNPGPDSDQGKEDDWRCWLGGPGSTGENYYYYNTERHNQCVGLDKGFCHHKNCTIGPMKGCGKCWGPNVGAFGCNCTECKGFLCNGAESIGSSLVWAIISGIAAMLTMKPFVATIGI